MIAVSLNVGVRLIKTVNVHAKTLQTRRGRTAEPLEERRHSTKIGLQQQRV